MKAAAASMNGLDYAIIAVIGLGTIYGLSRGALRMVTSLLSLIGALYAASLYHSAAASFANREFGAGSATARIIGYIAVFVLVFLAIELAGNIVIRLVHAVQMGWIDRLIGGLSGAAVAAIALGFVIMAMMLLLPARAEILKDSILAPQLLAWDNALLDRVPPELKAQYEARRAEFVKLWQAQARMRRELSPAPSPSPR
ncbi:MAG TPA: CvpA family protein [Candidatus Binataceae bacterium]|nr:CvpA family protein [Candidatus Binataceae bacterium]